MSFPNKLKQTTKGPCTIKIIQINDVYKLENLPYLKSCKDIESASFDGVTICALPGDFLSPSALSGIDHGAGMVECLNLAGVDYASFGNHESDIPYPQLLNRIRESKFKWVNTNIKDLKLPGDIPPIPDLIEIEAHQGEQTRRIALLGLITEDPTLYLKGAFGGATILPLIDTAKTVFDKLTAEGKYDAIIPLTHESIDEDRKLAKAVPFPVIVGGHDHEPYHETIRTQTSKTEPAKETQIIKTGMDGSTIGIIELTWPDVTSKKPLVSITFRPSSYYAPDLTVQQAVAKNLSILEHVKKSPLFSIPQNSKVPFSSEGIRSSPSPVATMLLTTVRKALDVDCVLFNAGAIRAAKNYTALGQKEFFYSDLESEIPFDTQVVVLQVPGQVILDIVSETRAPALKNPPEIYGRYCQTDDSITWDPLTNKVTAIAGKPVDPAAFYTIATLHVLTGALQESPPLLNYVKTLKPNSLPDIDACLGAKQIIVSYLSKFLLFGCIETIGFANISEGKDEITKEELEKALIAYETKEGDNDVVADKEVIAIIVKNLFAIADLDHSGKIDKKELIQLRLSMAGDLNFSATGSQFTIEEATKEITKALGLAENDSTVEDIVKSLDKNGSGQISTTELRSYIQNLSKEENQVTI